MPSNNNEKILIIGGGVAGSSLAIRLRKQGWEVCIVEKDKFPRHKLCGEFVSPECFLHFEELDVLDSISRIGGEAIFETRFFSESGRSVAVPSKWFSGGMRGALGISRSEMDYCLLEKARELGAEVLEGSRVTKISLDGKRIESVVTKNYRGETRKKAADLIVDATGRARALSMLLEKKTSQRHRAKKIKHVAFKVHLENVNLEKGICEIYFFRGGYGGLNYVENGVANHCFILDSNVARENRSDADRILKEVIYRNERAYEALKDSEKKFDWLAVPVERFGRQPSNDIENLISVGDASAFIDPFTGSGMLMALESAKFLASEISKSRRESRYILDLAIKPRYEKIYRRKTNRRLKLCSIVHPLSYSPIIANFVIVAARFNNNLLRQFTSSTRPA